MRTIEEVLTYVEGRVADYRASHWPPRAEYMDDMVRGAGNALKELRDFIRSGPEDPHPWGPEPSAEEASGHAARPECSMGLWLFRKRVNNYPFLCIQRLRVEDGVVVYAGRGYPVQIGTALWRPIDDEGVLVPRPTRTT